MTNDQILDAVQSLTGVYWGMVPIHAIAKRVGTSIESLEAPLRQLERAGQIRLDPLSDPSVVPPPQRGLGIRDAVRGLLFYVSPKRRRS
jgi:hypothetical protein